MNRPEIVIPLVLLTTALGAVGQTFLKRAVSALPAGVGAAAAVLGLATSPTFWTGILLTGSGTVAWLVTLSKADLTYAMPFAGMGIALVMVAGALILREPIGWQRLVGTAVILVGVTLVARH